MQCLVKSSPVYTAILFFTFPVNWDPSNYSVLDIVKALFMVLEDLVDDEEAQVTGINLLVDLEGMGTQHVMQMGPNVARKVTSIFQVSAQLRRCFKHTPARKT